MSQAPSNTTPEERLARALAHNDAGLKRAQPYGNAFAPRSNSEPEPDRIWLHHAKHGPVVSVLNSGDNVDGDIEYTRSDLVVSASTVGAAMDCVVDAAVAWHQSGQEGDETWFDKGEVLGQAVDRLLAMRETPSEVSKSDEGEPMITATNVTEQEVLEEGYQEWWKENMEINHAEGLRAWTAGRKALIEDQTPAPPFSGITS